MNGFISRGGRSQQLNSTSTIQEINQQRQLNLSLVELIYWLLWNEFVDGAAAGQPAGSAATQTNKPNQFKKLMSLIGLFLLCFITGIIKKKELSFFSSLLFSLLSLPPPNKAIDFINWRQLVMSAVRHAEEAEREVEIDWLKKE